MIKYPLEFTSETHSISDVDSNWKTRSKNMEIPISIPPEFMGPGGAFSPEDLFNYALANCFVATFKVYAKNSRLTFEEIATKSKLIVDLNEQKHPVMKEFYLTADIKGPSNPERALNLAKKASESGFILNSVRTTCHYEFHIVLLNLR